MAEPSRLDITHAHAIYRMPHDHPAPEALQARLDDVAAWLARDALPTALRPLLDDQDDSIWVIRRLEVGLTVNAAWDRETAAAAWAAAIARRMARLLDAGPDGDNVVRYANGAEFLAAFIGDLTDGRAWSSWRYRAFDGLRSLPLSAALRTALCDEPARGRAALLHLPERALRAVLGALTGADAAQVLEALATGATTHAAGALLPAAAVAQRFDLGEEQTALLLALEASRVQGEAPSVGLMVAVRGLARRLREGADLIATRDALLYGDPAALYMAARADAERLAPLLAYPAETRAALVAAVASGEMAPVRRYTLYGGCFLLLRQIDRLPLGAMLADFPPLPGDARAAMLLLLLARIGGPGRGQAIFSDPLLRDLCGVAPELSPADAADWLRRAGPEAWDTFRGGLGALDAADLRTDGVGIVEAATAGGDALVLVDLATGAWRAVAPWGRRGTRQPGVAPILAEYDEAVQYGAPEGPTNAEGETAARLARVADELRFLRAPAHWACPRRADFALALAAQRLLRAFSRDLRGFEQSGAAYLFDNFLDFAAALEPGEPAARVYCTRPRLGLVMRRAGLLRTGFRLSWSGQRFELYEEGDA